MFSRWNFLSCDVSNFRLRFYGKDFGVFICKVFLSVVILVFDFRSFDWDWVKYWEEFVSLVFMLNWSLLNFCVFFNKVLCICCLLFFCICFSCFMYFFKVLFKCVIWFFDVSFWWSVIFSCVFNVIVFVLVFF